MWVTFTVDKTADNEVVFECYSEDDDERGLPGHVSTPELSEFVPQRPSSHLRNLSAKGRLR